jgi:hypothetical protein
VRILFCCSFAFATFAFASAILVNSLLTFFSASAVSLPAGILPFRALVSCCAAELSGETVGLVIYWCLKNTVSLTLVALVFVKYILKHWWCSIDILRLNPALVWVSHVRLFLGLMWIWTAHPISANGFFM